MLLIKGNRSRKLVIIIIMARPHYLFQYLGISVLLTRRGEEKAPLAVVGPKMIFMSYEVVDDVLRRVEGVGPFRSAYPRHGTRTIAVKSGVHVIVGDNNLGGLWREQFFSRLTIRTGRVHVSIVCRFDIDSKPVQMQRVVEEDVLGTSGQGRRLPRTDLARAVVRPVARAKGKHHHSATRRKSRNVPYLCTRHYRPCNVSRTVIRAVRQSPEARGPKQFSCN